MADPGVTPSAPPGPRPKQMPKRGIHKEDEVQVVASCPEDHHDQVMNICKGSGMLKAFGKQGDFIDQLKSGARWFDLWKAKVCQTVLVATMHAECSVVRIFCIEGGPHCDEEFRTIPDLKKAVTDDMKKQNGREVEVVCEWMTMELFERDFGSHVKPDGKERKARLLGILDKDPQLAESVAIMKKHVSEEALRTCKRVVIIGETGAGKSAFCGLLEGSLEFVDGHWTSTFKLGHGGSSETNEPKLLAAQWRVRDDVLPILLVDTPGLGDSRGPQKDDEHMAEVARWVNGLGHVHAMVILLKNETRISHSLRENLQFFQRRFGKKMWDHTLMVVNKRSHETKAQKKRKAGKLQSAKQFEEEFRQMLQQDASGDGEDSDLGVGLSKERAEKVPFFFVDTHYDRDDEDEVKSMENELREMKRWLRSLLEWKVGANSQSEELKDLIHAVKTTGLAEPLKEALQTALNVARRSSPPKDLTQEKLDAVEEEIRCRRQDERLEEAKSVLSDFQRTGRKEDADSFLKKLDAVNQPTMPVSSETDYLAQIGELLRLALAGEPIHEKRMHFPELSGAFQQHLEALMEHGKKQKDAESRIQTIFKRWNIQETKEVVTEVARWAIEKGVCEEADLVLIIDPMPALTTVGQTRITLLRDWYHYKDSAGYDLKKVKEIQERALRANVEQEVLDDIKAKQKKDSALEKLKEAISEESTEKAGPCLADCEALNVSAEELEFAKKWLEAAKHKENGVDQLQRALNKNDSNEVEEALKYATTVCSVPEDHQKVREARMWLKERKREEEKRKQEEDPEQVEADEAAAAKYDDIARAALNGDLPAVRGHLRRDRGSLDRLFDGVAALHCAAYNGHRAIVAFLVAKGAAVDVPGLGRDTPLHQAARYGRVECAQLLLAAKASVHIKDIAGRTPLDFAREQGHTEIVNLLMAKA